MIRLRFAERMLLGNTIKPTLDSPECALIERSMPAASRQVATFARTPNELAAASRAGSWFIPAIDTTSPAGKLLFQVTGAFAEFERSMIRQRVRAGLSVIKGIIARDGEFKSKAGVVRKRLGRPGGGPEKFKMALRELEKGTGIAKTARLVGLGTGTVHKLKRGMVTDAGGSQARR